MTSQTLGPLSQTPQPGLLPATAPCTSRLSAALTPDPCVGPAGSQERDLASFPAANGCLIDVGGLFSARGRVPAAGKHKQPPGLFPATMRGDVCVTVWWSPRRSCHQECGTSSCGGQRSEGQRSQATLPGTPVTGGRGRWWPLGRSPDLFFLGHSLQ